MAVIFFVFMLFALMLQFCGGMVNVMRECEKMHKIRNEMVNKDYISAMETNFAAALVNGMIYVYLGVGYGL